MKCIISGCVIKIKITKIRTVPLVKSHFNQLFFYCCVLMESQSIDFKNESNRLGTFTGWPVSFIISPKSLAAAGFYYTNQTDKVKCAFCNICVCHWEFGDNAIDEHKRHNPNCSFMLSQDCGNIPIIEGIQLREEYVENRKETGEPIDIRGLGVREHRVAFHLKYNSYCARLKTFRSWTNVTQKPEDLATAGFFFTGSNDEVRCYYCDGGLQNWDIDDNPWVEHAKWFPNCCFLNLVKGEKFLDGNLIERFNALLSRSRSDETTSSSSQEVVSIHQTDNVLPDNNNSSIRRNEVTDHQLNELMVLPPAIMALELGLQPSQVRQAIRNNLRDIGRPFRSADSFIQQILTQDETSFITDGSPIIPIQQMIQREEELRRGNVHLRPDDNDCSSAESSDSSDESLEIIHRTPELEHITTSESENEISSISEPAIASVNIHLINQSNDIKVNEEVDVPNVESESTKLSQSDLEEENRRLKEARLCKICLDQELSVVMLPCAHLVACITCASSLPDCPLCRQTIKATVRTFLS